MTFIVVVFIVYFVVSAAAALYLVEHGVVVTAPHLRLGVVPTAAASAAMAAVVEHLVARWRRVTELLPAFRRGWT